MIIVKLLGGLGNQMFQYALGRHLSIINNTSLKLDVNELLDRKPKDYVPRNFGLDKFNIKASCAAPSDNSRFFLRFDTKYHLVKGKIGRCLTNSSVHFEKTNQFDPNILKAGFNSYLAGYWQTEKYFKEIESVLRKEFTLKVPLSAEAKDIAQQITNTHSVSIHIRRGDYVTNKVANEILGVCSLQYYENAIRLLSSTIENPYFFIFSDDIEWVKKELVINYPYRIVENLPDYMDLHLMSLCKHNILANSSFSWWAGWLNNNQKKNVLYPRIWFKDTSIKTIDLLPADWQNIEN